MRSPYDVFSWLASKHRRMPEKSSVQQQEEIQLSMRYIVGKVLLS